MRHRPAPRTFHFRGAPNPVRRRKMVVLALLLLAGAGGCAFERRGDDGSAAQSGGPIPVNEGEFAEELARQTVRLFRDAVVNGDISLALSMLDEGATVIDPLAGRSSEGLAVGEVLLELRRIHAGGMRYEPAESAVLLLPSGPALVQTSYILLEEVEGLGTEAGRIQESAFLTPTLEGWKILHIHRSRSELP